LGRSATKKLISYVVFLYGNKNTTNYYITQRNGLHKKNKIYDFCAFFLTECIFTCRETPEFGGTSCGTAGLYGKITRIFEHSVIQKLQTRAT